MKYAERLKRTFGEVDLDVCDLFLLEPFQVAYLPDRVPEREFAAVLWANHLLRRHLRVLHPPMEKYIDDLLEKYGPAETKEGLRDLSDELVWEIGDLLVYNRAPEVYDSRAHFGGELEDITVVAPLEDKVVIEAGAGTGRLAFMVAALAGTVHAVEPVGAMREFMRKKKKETGVKNLFIHDGFLHDLPFAEDSADVLLTRQAIGWKLEEELEEIERVVRTGGHALHLSGISTDAEDDPWLDLEALERGGYECREYGPGGGKMRMYHKVI